jgi:hypothetical protein
MSAAAARSRFYRKPARRAAVNQIGTNGDRYRTAGVLEPVLWARRRAAIRQRLRPHRLERQPVAGHPLRTLAGERHRRPFGSSSRLSQRSVVFASPNVYCCCEERHVESDDAMPEVRRQWRDTRTVRDVQRDRPQQHGQYVSGLRRRRPALRPVRHVRRHRPGDAAGVREPVAIATPVHGRVRARRRATRASSTCAAVPDPRHVLRKT